MNTPRDWKSEEILKLAGSVVREGVFQGHPGEDTNNPHALKPSKITPDVIEKAFKNIDGPIPIFSKHDMKGQPRHQTGSTFHAGITQAKDDIEVRGMIWDKAEMNRIRNLGLNRFSPEFDFDYDVQGNIVNARLVGLIPTNSPAISNPPITAVATVFDIGDNMTPGTPAAPAAPAAPAQPVAPPVAPPVQTTIVQPAPGYTVPPAVPVAPPAVVPSAQPGIDNSVILAQLNQFSQQMAANQETIKRLVAENDAMKTGSVNTLLAEVKALGIAAPENMIQGLPADSQLNVLKMVKETLALKAPIAQGGSAGTGPAPTQQDVENSILKEIGISRKEYDKLMASPCPSLMKEE